MPLPADLKDDWPVISQLLDEALTLPPTQRGDFLAGLPPQRAPLRDTLRELLAQADGIETADFLATLPRFTQGAARGPLAELAVGDTIGPYRLISELGSGGMGAVWLAERADGQFKRKVALKLPRLAWVKGLADRMARERDILAKLEHPNIARLYDAGLDAMGRPYLALEYVEGQPIDVYCRERGLGVKDRLPLLLQVCSAVAYAHSRLVVHRDLKPSNILVTADGQVRLLDFGIAKLMEGDSAAETQLTQLAGRALTLDYASPEQIKGEPIGTASDVFSLGVVAYELLTGARPYKLKRGSAAELEEAIATADPLRASEAATDPLFRKALNGDLDAILNKALKKSTAERYATVDALALDIRRHDEGEPVEAVPDSLRYRLGKLIVRRKLEAAIAGGAVVALVGGAYGQIAVAAALTLGAAVGAWQFRRARAAASRAADERNRALLEVATSREVTQFVVSLFAVPNPPDIEIIDRGLARVRAEDGAVSDAVRARLVKTLGDLYYNIGHYERARNAHDEAARLALTPGREDPRTAAAARAAQALDEHYLDVADQGKASAQKALVLIEQHGLDENWLLADASTALGVALTSLGEYAAALPHVQRAVQLNEAFVGPFARRTLAARGDEARLASNAGQHEQAEALFRTLLVDIEAHLGRSDSLYLLAMHNLGNLLARTGQLTEAEACLRTAIALREAIYGADHPTGSLGMGILASVLLKAGQPAESAQLTRRALNASLRGNPTALVNTPRLCRLLAWAQLQCGCYEPACSAFDQAMAPLDPLARQSLRAQFVVELMIAGRMPEACAEGALLRSERVPTTSADVEHAVALLDTACPWPPPAGEAATRPAVLDALLTSAPSDDVRRAIQLSQARLARASGNSTAAAGFFAQALDEPVLQSSRCSPRWLPAMREWVEVLDPALHPAERRQLAKLIAEVEDALAAALADTGAATPGRPGA
jgi:eukaryotic-like serine/threonine-protein kinase